MMHRFARGGHCDDTESLQTDVMRFMAIIGLCLTAVFALVQSLPDAPTSSVEQAFALATVTIAEQQKELQALREDLSALRDRLVAQVEHEAVLTRSLSSERARQEELNAEVRQLQTELDRMQGSLTIAKREAEAREVSRRAQARRLAEHDARLVRYRQQVDALRRKQAGGPVQSAETPAKPLPARQGFSLRFASVDALDRLVTGGRVGFYGIADKQAWQLVHDAGQVEFVHRQSPTRFHEMDRSTVPARYVTALSRVSAGPGVDTVTWGVALPEAIVTRIASLTSGSSGGDLVIAADGQVRLETATGER